MTIVDFDYSTMRYGFSFLMLLVVFLARFISVFAPPALYYLFTKSISLTLTEMKIIWYSGLVRGKSDIILVYLNRSNCFCTRMACGFR